MLYQTVWKPSIEYILPQTFLSKGQLNSIEKSCLPKIKSICGYNKTTKLEILEAPLELSGGGFTPLHVTAGAGYVLHFIRNWRTETENLGKMIRICYAWSAANAGVSFPLFESPEIEIPHLRGKVIPAIREFLASIDAKIHLDCTMIRPKLRENDKCLMDIALEMDSPQFTKIQLEQINAVREYFDIQYISEICEPNGTKLAKGIYYHYSAEKWYHNRFPGPKQNKPNNRSWELWRRLLNHFINEKTLMLKQPLGQWTSDHSKRGIWKAYRVNDLIYEYIKTETSKTWSI